MYVFEEYYKPGDYPPLPWGYKHVYDNYFLSSLEVCHERMKIYVDPYHMFYMATTAMYSIFFYKIPFFFFQKKKSNSPGSQFGAS